MLIEIYNKVNRNLIKNFMILFSPEKYFYQGFKENHLKDFNKKCGMKKFIL